MKLFSTLFVVVAAFIVSGCGSGDTATAGEANAFKSHDKSAMSPPPPDAMKAPSDFKSSIGGSSPTGAAGGATAPGPGGK